MKMKFQHLQVHLTVKRRAKVNRCQFTACSVKTSSPEQFLHVNYIICGSTQNDPLQLQDRLITIIHLKAIEQQ